MYQSHIDIDANQGKIKIKTPKMFSQGSFCVASCIFNIPHILKILQSGDFRLTMLYELWEIKSKRQQTKRIHLGISPPSPTIRIFLTQLLLLTTLCYTLSATPHWVHSLLHKPLNILSPVYPFRVLHYRRKTMFEIILNDDYSTCSLNKSKTRTNQQELMDPPD